MTRALKVFLAVAALAIAALLARSVAAAPKAWSDDFRNMAVVSTFIDLMESGVPPEVAESLAICGIAEVEKLYSEEQVRAGAITEEDAERIFDHCVCDVLNLPEAREQGLCTPNATPTPAPRDNLSL